MVQSHDTILIVYDEQDMRSSQKRMLTRNDKVKERYPDTARVTLTGYAPMDGMRECLHNRIAKVERSSTKGTLTSTERA